MHAASARQSPVAACETSWSEFPEHLKVFRMRVDELRRFRRYSECQNDADELTEVCWHKRRSLDRLLDEIPHDSKGAYHLNRWRQQFEEVCKLLDSDVPSPLNLAPDALGNASLVSHPQSIEAAPRREDFSVAPLLLQSVDSEQLELEARQRREAELVAVAKDLEGLKRVQMEISSLVNAQEGDLDQVERHASNAKINSSEAKEELSQTTAVTSTNGVRRASMGVAAVTTGLTGGLVFGTVGAAVGFAVLGGTAGLALGQGAKRVIQRRFSV